MNRLIKDKDVLRLLEDATPISVVKDTAEFTFSDHLRHLHEHAGTIPAMLDEYGRCVRCVARGWFKPNA